LSDVFNESGHHELLWLLDALREPDLGERATNKVACSYEVPAEHLASAPTDSDISGLENVKRQERRIQQVPQFMREEAEALIPARRLSVEGGLIATAPELGHGTCDGVIKASVEGSKIVGANGSVLFQGQFGDGLTDISVVMHDLRHREALEQKVMPV
jgi:hypothetical protein